MHSINKKENSSSKIIFYSLLILCIFNGIQIGSYGIERFVPPLFGVIISFLVLTVTCFWNRKIEFKIQDFYIHLIPCVVLIICVSLGTPSVNEYIFDIIKISLAFSMSYLLVFQIQLVNPKKIDSLIKISIIPTIIILFIELYLRVVDFSGDVFGTLLSNFYLMKTNSPFFTDTNATALYALSYVIIIYYYNNFFISKKKLIYSLITSVLFIFIILSLSRAAIISTLALFAYSFFVKSKLQLRIIYLMIVIFITIFSFSYVIELVSSDGSGVSKILIFESVIKNFYKISSFEFLFGYGINQGNYIYSFYEGEYSHLLLTMLLGQVGLIGLIAYMFFFLMMILKSNNEVTIVFIPFFIVGLSYLHPFLESVFFSTGFVYGLSRIKNN